MTSPQSDPRDEWLLQELQAANADVTAVPPHARAAAEAIFTWRNIDDELTLALCFDSAVDDAALVRGPSSIALRSLSFGDDELGVEIQIDGTHVTGQLLPPQPGTVRIVATDGIFGQTAADAAGCFVIDRPPHGPVRLECAVDGSVLVTEWVPF